jgi:hypothetical protein
MAKKYSVPYVKNEALVTVKITGAFYARLQDLLVDYCKNQYPDLINNREQFQKKMLEITQSNSLTEPRDINLHTLLNLLYYLEEEFDKQGLIDISEIEISEDNVVSRLS